VHEYGAPGPVLMSHRSRRLPDAPEETGEVAALTTEGAGLVRSGKAVFVPGALPGESIRLRRTRRHRQHDDGDLLEVLRPSPQRVTPACAHFGVCGGCALQHLHPDAQLAAKEAELRDNLERLARVAVPEWLPALRGPVWGYRRRARLGARFVTKKGRVVVGFRERLAPYIADVQRCEVLAAPAGALVAPLARLLDGLSVREQVPQIEVAVADNATALVLRVLAAPAAADLLLLAAFEQEHAVRIYLQPAGLDSVRPLSAALAEPLSYALPESGLQLQFVPTDFVQINASVNAQLVSRATQLLGLQSDSTVLDLFCGIGNFTLAMARHAGHVVGVEGEQSLVARARDNAALNAIDNAEFFAADLAQPPRADVSWMQRRYTHILLDPPRAGAAAMLSGIAQLGAARVLYISCHPGSLARDIGVLVHSHGMAVRAAGVLDMFPHTTHVESLVVLEPGPGRRPA
jgi:23S rRNA (uracil1939-C5)-methyltransferase